MPTHSDKKSKTRLAIAGTLFLASIFASFVISFLSQSGDAYWVTRKPIASGVAITASDVGQVKAALSRGIDGYLPSQLNPVGSITKRNLRMGELLSRDSLSTQLSDRSATGVSIAIRSVDIPLEVSEGDQIDIYQIHDARNGEPATPPYLVIAGAFLRNIDRKANNFGGELSITVSVNRQRVGELLAATSSGRLVAVLAHG